MFDVEKKAVEYCETYNIPDTDPRWPDVVAAFCAGAKLAAPSQEPLIVKGACSGIVDQTISELWPTKAASVKEPDWIDVSNGSGGHRGEYDWKCSKCGKVDWFAGYTDPNKTGVKCSCSKTSQEPCAWKVGSQVFGDEELAGMSAKAACLNVHPLYRVPPDAAAQIADWKKTVMASLEMCRERDEQIAKLEAEIAMLRTTWTAPVDCKGDQ